MRGAATRQVQLLGFASPANFEAELDRVGRCFARGEPCEPRFVYGGQPAFDQALALALDEVARELAGAGPLIELYLPRRAALEAQLQRPAPAFGAPAARRFEVACIAARPTRWRPRGCRAAATGLLT
jgi:hypothetical protein